MAKQESPFANFKLLVDISCFLEPLFRYMPTNFNSIRIERLILEIAITRRCNHSISPSRYIPASPSCMQRFDFYHGGTTYHSPRDNRFSFPDRLPWLLRFMHISVRTVYRFRSRLIPARNTVRGISFSRRLQGRHARRAYPAIFLIVGAVPLSAARLRSTWIQHKDRGGDEEHRADSAFRNRPPSCLPPPCLARQTCVIVSL